MAFHRKTLELFAAVNAILAQYDVALTLRQVFYRLVSALVLPNTQRAYSNLSGHLVNARRAGIVDATRIVDRARRTLRVPCWDDLEDFLQTVRVSYRREKWASQRYNVEVWVEKDAIAGVLEPVCDEYEVLLFPCRGYDSYSAMREAGLRIGGIDRPTVVLYLGDFDPSGLDMRRDIRTRLAEDFGAVFHLHEVALTAEQVAEHGLPPNPVKLTDSRAAAYVERYGSDVWEVDALPPDVLQELVRTAIDEFFDMSAFEQEQEQEAEEQRRLQELLDVA